MLIFKNLSRKSLTSLISLFTYASSLWLGMGETRATAFNLSDTTIADIHAAYNSGQLTATELTKLYLNRIAAYEPTLNSLISLSPNALTTAAQLDARFEMGGLTGPLHGIPVILKDNFNTTDLPTTGGSLALDGFIPSSSAAIVKKLQDAGAIILGKSNLPDFAQGPTTLSSIDGLTLNPYGFDRISSGSSGGSAVAIAANLATVALGTDTTGSILSPSSVNNIVGLRPTTGLLDLNGIIPLNAFNDVAGPMTRNVTDAAILLEVMAGDNPNVPPNGYTASLDINGLRGARIGFLNEAIESMTFGPFVTRPDPEVIDLTNQAVNDLTGAGATVIPLNNFLASTGEISLTGFFANLQCQPAQFKSEVNRYLSENNAPFSSIEAIIATGQIGPFLPVDAILAAPAPENEPLCGVYQQARAGLTEAVLNVMDALDLDAIIYPAFNQPPLKLTDVGKEIELGVFNGNYLSWMTGFPAIDVPIGFTLQGLPVGIEFLGRGRFTEPTLLRLAYAYEQETNHRKLPSSTPPLAGETIQVPEPGGFVALLTFGLSLFASRKSGTQREK